MQNGGPYREGELIQVTEEAEVGLNPTVAYVLGGLQGTRNRWGCSARLWLFWAVVMRGPGCACATMCPCPPCSAGCSWETGADAFPPLPPVSCVSSDFSSKEALLSGRFLGGLWL